MRSRKHLPQRHQTRVLQNPGPILSKERDTTKTHPDPQRIPLANSRRVNASYRKPRFQGTTGRHLFR
jgi:hypothetical protein